MKIKGVILGGGRGTRLKPFTHIINKHLLPVYDKPLIYYPLLTLKAAGIKDVLIISDPESLPHYKKLLKNGRGFGLNISFAVQEKPLGLAHALSHAEEFANGHKLVVIFGDNVFMNSGQIVANIKKFSGNGSKGCKLFLKEVPDPERFGVANLKNGKICSIVEKPKKPLSNLAVTGLYFYDQNVFSLIKTLKPSSRGELEITDLNNLYLKRKLIDHEIIQGEWVDAGTFDSLLYASLLMLKQNKNLPDNIGLI